MTLTFGSLFSGIGGFDLGFERAGMECRWQCEIDARCQEVLKQRFNKPIIEDVRNVRAGSVEPVDVICGGFPCQDLSVAGKRAGLAGERSGLWFEFARVIDELEPGWVVIENVPGLLSSGRGRDFAVILRWLAERGYGVAWRVLDAQYAGLAQRRRRVFIVGSLGSGRSAEVLFEREGVRWNPPTRTEKGQGITSTTGDSASTLRGFGHGWQGQHNSTNAVAVQLTGDRDNPSVSTYDDVMPTIPANPMSDRVAGVMVPEVTRPLFAAMGTKWNGNGDLESSLVAAPLVARQGKGPFTDPANDNIVCIPINTMAATRPESAEQNRQTFGVGEDGDPMFALHENHSHAIGIGVGVRRLTPTECERLQGFPDGWTFGSDSTRYRQLGNAVAVPVVEWIGKRIVEVSNGKR